jgi:hypothetical protein
MWRLSTTTLCILLTSIVNFGAHLSSRKFLRTNCSSYPRELCEITNLIRDWPGLPEIINISTNEILPERVNTLSTLFKSTIKLSTASHLVHICLAHMRFVTCSKDPSRFLRSYVRSVSKETYKNFSDNSLGFSGST